jgi:sulfoxide reductase heme-binding subunit YedZ
MKIRWTKVLLFLLCLSPLFWAGWRAWNQDLTANPIEYVTHFTGDWTIRFIVFSLAVSPLRKLFRRPQWIRYRRMIGLFAFFYGSLHFMTWLWLDKFFDTQEMWKDVIKRPFITAGFLAFVLMIPLAVTSTSGWIRRLGGKNWNRLHKLIYVTAIAGVIHYYWLVKSDVRLPLLYGCLVGLELLFRAGAWALARRQAPQRKAVQPAVT